ncbi:MAG: hypothetical protein ACLP66_23910 [Polyangia bacterium]|jgi:hypothetical protein
MFTRPVHKGIAKLTAWIHEDERLESASEAGTSAASFMDVHSGMARLLAGCGNNDDAI